MGTFTLPETCAALRRWEEITGLTEESTEWGEVERVLADTQLLDADRAPQRHLFTPPDTPLGDTPEVRALRLAIIGGAQLHVAVTRGGDGWCPHDVAICTAIVAAMIACHYHDITDLPVEQGLYLLETELPLRIRGVAVRPGVALKWWMSDPFVTGEVDAAGVLGVLVRAAWDDDEFAARVFDRLAEDSHHRVGLAGLSDGSWLIYDCAERL